jgi:Xaa-Pro aminopeptidase
VVGSQAEMTRVRDDERIRRISESLHEADLDALVCSLPANVLLLTGYWPVIGSSIAIATRESAFAVITPEDECDLADGGWAVVRPFKPADLHTVSAITERAREPLRELTGKLGLTGRIGYESAQSEPASYAGMTIYGAAMPQLLADVFPNAQLTPADNVLSKLRSVKTARELECIRRSCRVAAEAFDRAASQLRPGMKETEVAALFQSLLAIAGTTNNERAGGFVYCMSGSNSAEAYAAYARTRSRVIKEGDLVLVHCNSYVDGYWTDITRTYCIGRADSRSREMREAVMSARSKALEAIHPGVMAREVDRAAREQLDSRGFGSEFKHSTGHGVGFVAIDHTAQPRLHPASPDRLEAGMIFNVEPAIYIEGYGGLRHCDMVVVNHSGAELLTDFQVREEELQLAA